MGETRAAINLLEDWERFRREHPAGEKTDFARWLLSENAPVSAADEGYAGYLLGRLARFSALWSKKMFDDLPLRTFEELGILLTVERFPGARKSDVVAHALLEPTTCFEILKRLGKAGLIEEQPDPTDRRARRVYLTPTGADLCRRAQTPLADLATLLLGRLSPADKRDFTRLLQQLDEFHSALHAGQKDASLRALAEQLR